MTGIISTNSHHDKYLINHQAVERLDNLNWRPARSLAQRRKLAHHKYGRYLHSPLVTKRLICPVCLSDTVVKKLGEASDESEQLGTCECESSEISHQNLRATWWLLLLFGVPAF